LAHTAPRIQGLLFCNREMRPDGDDKLLHKMLRPLLHRLNMYSPGKAFPAIRHIARSVLLESGASIIQVQKQPRRTSATTTLNIYGHVLGRFTTLGNQRAGASVRYLCSHIIRIQADCFII
jgi:integrase